MNNEELAKKIIENFDWWELDNEQDNYNEILFALNNNNQNDIKTIISYFTENIENDFRKEDAQIILKELKNRLKE
jgi:mannitol/fructose-specific phosphotransferase system IIA component (Ntr-type)